MNCTASEIRRELIEPTVEIVLDNGSVPGLVDELLRDKASLVAISTNRKKAPFQFYNMNKIIDNLAIYNYRVFKTFRRTLHNPLSI